MEADEVLDVSGLACPMPVLKTKQAMNKLESGKTMKVIATDKGSKSDIPAWVKQTGNELLDMTEEGEKFIYIIKKS